MYKETFLVYYHVKYEYISLIIRKTKWKSVCTIITYLKILKKFIYLYATTIAMDKNTLYQDVDID